MLVETHGGSHSNTINLFSKTIFLFRSISISQDILLFRNEVALLAFIDRPGCHDTTYLRDLNVRQLFIEPDFMTKSVKFNPRNVLDADYLNSGATLTLACIRLGTIDRVTFVTSEPCGENYDYTWSSERLDTTTTQMADFKCRSWPRLRASYIAKNGMDDNLADLKPMDSKTITLIHPVPYKVLSITSWIMKPMSNGTGLESLWEIKCFEPKDR